MNRSLGKILHGLLAALILTSFALTTVAEAQRGGGRGGGGGGGGGGAARQNVQVNNSRADVRTNNVRSTSVNNVNNVNVQRNTNVNVQGGGCCCCGGGWDHPVATAAAVGATVAVTSAVVGSMVRTVPAGCVPVNYAGMVYQQCGGTWYQPSGAQYMVVSPPY